MHSVITYHNISWQVLIASTASNCIWNINTYVIEIYHTFYDIVYNLCLYITVRVTGCVCVCLPSVVLMIIWLPLRRICKLIRPTSPTVDALLSTTLPRTTAWRCRHQQTVTLTRRSACASIRHLVLSTACVESYGIQEGSRPGAPDLGSHSHPCRAPARFHYEKCTGHPGSDKVGREEEHRFESRDWSEESGSDDD